MRILQICSARDIGGGERHVADLANALVGRGHDVFAVVSPNAALIGELDSLPREHILELRMRGGADILSVRNVAAIVRENKIDIIHAHVGRDYPLAALSSARSGGTPFVLTRHVLFPLNKIHRLVLRKASRVIAVSNVVAESLRGQRIFDPDKVVTIHNGVDVSRFDSMVASSARPAALEGLDAKCLVGTIGHLAPIKGHETFVRAAAIVARERDDVDFVIVGEDKSPPGENRAELEKLIETLGLKKRVHLAGWQDDTAAVLRHLGIFVSAARTEPFGLVMVEAMAAGVPVVATASEGALEIIDDGVTGLIVPIGDPDAIAASIKRLLAEPDLCRRLAETGLMKAKENFSQERMVDATEMVYREVLE